MVGAMGQEQALRLFRSRQQVVITGGRQVDIQSRAGDADQGAHPSRVDTGPARWSSSGREIGLCR